MLLSGFVIDTRFIDRFSQNTVVSKTKLIRNLGGEGGKFKMSTLTVNPRINAWGRLFEAGRGSGGGGEGRLLNVSLIMA